MAGSSWSDDSRGGGNIKEEGKAPDGLQLRFLLSVGLLADAGGWARLTVQLSLMATVAGFLLGTLCAVASTSGSRILRAIVGLYVEFIRNTPLLVQLFVVFFGLASLGLKFAATTSAVIGLTINIGAYSSEIIRAGIESLHKGQIEAGDCLALSRWQVLAAIVLPTAIEKVYPALARNSRGRLKQDFTPAACRLLQRYRPIPDIHRLPGSGRFRRYAE